MFLDQTQFIVSISIVSIMLLFFDQTQFIVSIVSIMFLSQHKSYLQLNIDPSIRPFHQIHVGRKWTHRGLTHFKLQL